MGQTKGLVTMPRRPGRLGRFSPMAMWVSGVIIASAAPFANCQQAAPAPVQRMIIRGNAVVQEKEKTDENAAADAVALPRNSESKRLIKAAEDYIKLKEWRTAGECLQKLLENPDDAFVEVKRK